MFDENLKKKNGSLICKFQSWWWLPAQILILRKVKYLNYYMGEIFLKFNNLKGVLFFDHELIHERRTDFYFAEN